MMNEILMSVYGAVLPAAPFVIAAYALILVALFAYVAIVVRGLKKNERDIEALEDAVARMGANRDV
jgi:hypothetical protein